MLLRIGIAITLLAIIVYMLSEIPFLTLLAGVTIVAATDVGLFFIAYNLYRKNK